MYQYFYVDLLVGTPPQRTSVILDTGSGLVAFPCSGCAHCGRHIDPSFDVSKSSTAHWVGCGDDCHGSCSSRHCKYHQGYQEGSAIDGYYFDDYVRLGDAIQRNPKVVARMGCHQTENKLFYTQRANGILGIRGERNLLQTLFRDTAHIESRVFAICLAEWGGRLVVGGSNESYHTGPVQWTPLQVSSYSVTLNSMAIDGQTLSTQYHGAIIDSGTTYTYMGAGPYNALVQGIENYCNAHNSCGARRQGKCWFVLDLYEGLKRFPVVDVFFGNAKTTWDARGYMYRKRTSIQWCYAFENDGPNAGTTLGASWMQHKEVIFDLRQNRVGIAPANCPEFKERPNHPSVIQDNPNGTTSTPSAVGTPRKPWRKIRPVQKVIIIVGLAAVAIVCVVTSGLCIAWHLTRGKEVRHLALEETGGPAVPAVTIGPEMFPRSDDNDEDEGLAAVQNVGEEELRKLNAEAPLE